LNGHSVILYAWAAPPGRLILPGKFRGSALMCASNQLEVSAVPCYDRLASWLIVNMSDARRLRARWLCSIVIN
jgi:hypothetical protein